MFINDIHGSLICTQQFDVKTATMQKPAIILRKKIDDSLTWEVTAMIQADKAIYNPASGRWDLVNGRLIEKGSDKAPLAAVAYSTDITPKDIPVRRQAEHKTFLSSRQLTALAEQKTKIKDLAQLYSQKYFRISDPIINIVMLLISLPVLVCRDPKTMKSAVLVSFTMTGACLATGFICKLMAPESVFGVFIPEFWAWLPVVVFLPLAVMQLDSMKT
jgi:lipopolysaccharide export LptBFGC system permease protein LptF